MKKLNLLITIIFSIVVLVSCKEVKEGKKDTITPKIEKSSSGKDFTFDKSSFKFSITGYGAKDKSYVVDGIVFKKYKVSSVNNKLQGAEISIDPTSIDTSFNLNNGQGGKWPESFASIRNGNVINGFFNNLDVKGNVIAKVVNVTTKEVVLEVSLNGVKKIVHLNYSIEGAKLIAKGKIDVLDFNASNAFKQFSAICTNAFHQGKTWSEIGLAFEMKI